jgi:hypothetical protein
VWLYQLRLCREGRLVWLSLLLRRGEWRYSVAVSTAAVQ